MHKQSFKKDLHDMHFHILMPVLNFTFTYPDFLSFFLYVFSSILVTVKQFLTNFIYHF